MENKVTKDDFLQMAKTAADFSAGKIRIAFNESDTSTEKDLEAAHFLKLNEKRVGRDMEVYGIMAKVSPEQSLVDFLELLLLIKGECPESYQKAAVQLKELGAKVYKDDVLQSWNGLFN